MTVSSLWWDVEPHTVSFHFRMVLRWDEADSCSAGLWLVSMVYDGV